MLKMRKLNEEYIIDKKGNKKSVIIPLERYMELLEDMNDLAIIAERKSEKEISTEEVKKKVKTKWHYIK